MNGSFDNEPDCQGQVFTRASGHFKKVLVAIKCSTILTSPSGGENPLPLSDLQVQANQPFLRIIAGLLAPDAGEIYVQGQKREGLIEDAADPVGIGMVFQQAALFDSLTVRENVGFLLYQHSKLSAAQIEKLVDDVLELVGLPGIGNSYPAELSGGMRKRVSFARAIVANPDNPEDRPALLLYDEPTAGLDPIASTVIEDLIRDIQRGNGCSSYIIVTHQDSTIRRTADRVVFLHRGQIQWTGSVGEIDDTD